MNSKNFLFLLDFSGTLSLESVLFSRKEKLQKAFSNSGLSDLGLNNDSLFWKEIVNPTWIEGSTTSIGYKKLLSSKLQELGYANKAKADSSASKFVDLYLKASTISKIWNPILNILKNNSNCTTIIITDHYAELTSSLMNRMELLGFPTVSITSEMIRNYRFLIANSADIGFLKKTKKFWKYIHQKLFPNSYDLIFLIDDFGFNEVSQDDYSKQEKVHTRKDIYCKLIKNQFQAPIRCFPFFISSIHSCEENIYKKEFSKKINDIYSKILEELK